MRRLTHEFGYLRPWRARSRVTGIGCGYGRVHRAWFRYVLVQATAVPGGGTVFTERGRVWTRRGARRAVDALRRSA